MRGGTTLSTTTETPIPFDKNHRAQSVLSALSEGPQSTLDLQERFLIHPARQIWELRHWYGKTIKTGRLPNRVAVYRLEEAA